MVSTVFEIFSERCTARRYPGPVRRSYERIEVRSDWVEAIPSLTFEVSSFCIGWCDGAGVHPKAIC
jgi:hypothetical protein